MVKKIKRKMLLSGILSILTASVFTVLLFHNEREKLPQPPQPVDTKIIHNEKDVNHQKRSEWIEEMHKTAPGTNWRLMDQKTRLKKAKQRILNSNERSLSHANGISGTWREVGSKNLAGRIHVADVDANAEEIYCGSSGGNIWWGDLNGNNWTSLNDYLRMPGIKSVRVIKKNSMKRILVCSETYFYYSDDNGANWNTASGLSAPANWGSLKKAIIANNSQNSIYLIAEEWDNTNWNAQTTIYVSTDKGNNFIAVTSFDRPTYGDANQIDTWTGYYGSGDVYLIENNNIYTFDSSNNLSKISSFSIKNPGKTRLTGCQSGGKLTLYALVYDSTQSDIYGSNDGGLTWSYRGNIKATPFMDNSFACSVVDHNKLYMGGVNCWRSYDEGYNWAKVNDWEDYYGSESNKLHADTCGINSFKDSKGDEYVLISTDGGIYISNDSLLTVQNLSLNNLNVSQYYSTYTSRVNTNVLHAGSQDQGYQISKNSSGPGTIDLTQVISGDYGHIVSGDNGKSIWMVYPGFAAYFPDIINSLKTRWWNFVCTGQYWMPPLMADPMSPDKVYLGGGNTSKGTHIFHLNYNSNSNNISYTELPFDFSNGENGVKISAMSCSHINTNYRYVFTSSGNFYTSTDGGSTWTLSQGFSGPQSHYFYGADILSSSIILGRIYIAGSGYSNSPVFKSDDNGKTFVAMSTGLPSTMVYQLAAGENEDKIFAATEQGPYVFDSSKNQWYDISNGVAPDQVYWTVDYIASLKTARFGTYGRGIWDFILSVSPTLFPQIAINRSGLNFGSTKSGSSTGSQSLLISNSGSGTLNWSITDTASWLSCCPFSGTNSGEVTVSVNPTGLSAGTYTGTITVSDPNATNSPQSVSVTLQVYNNGATSVPFGEFATPINGSTVRSSIAVTGWALDDIGVESIKIYRSNSGSLVYIGDAIFVEGARPDVEQAYPDYPMNYKAGWGYMMLTNPLPNGGNGTFKIHAIATDVEGHQVTLKTKTITVDNANAVKPFGAIDTPTQGGTASGDSFINWGWVLTPQPNSIPTDGSTINVFVDSVNLGHPTYNIYRSDIATLFPGYANSDGAIGYFSLDTTTYENGVHTIYWTARDSAGNTDGIGSRYFAIQNAGCTNSGFGVTCRIQSIPGISIKSLKDLPVDRSIPVSIRKGFGKNFESQEVYTDNEGLIKIEIKELERVELNFSNGSAGISQISGYMVVGNQLRSLPIGSTLDSSEGKFYWQPGPGFIGEYRFVFIKKCHNMDMSLKNIILKLVPRYKFE